MAPPGPLIVLAGAGTGKTRVIACRIAHLLDSDPTLRPANLLALTFSRKAAQEMLQRVEGLLGAYADELGTFTFHGFCHRFLQDHPLESGLPDRFRLLDSADAWVFFRSLLPKMKLRHYWNLADPTGCIRSFLRFISRAKDEGVTPEEYEAYAARQEDPTERAQAQEAARVYRMYQEALGRAGRMDFGDLMVRTVQVLRERPVLLRQVRQQYRAILVDEFQDTNVEQIELLKLLAGPEPNLCVVGDDDQAIYRFRGASFASFLLIQQAYPHSRVLRLTRNYRSTPAILAVSERLIRQNGPDRYDPQKKLWTPAQECPPVEAFVCQDGEHEADQAVTLLRSLWEAQPPADRRWGRIAVLYRAHAHREPLGRRLEEAGIPFAVRGGFSLFDQPETRDLLAFLDLLHDPSDSIPLFRLMSHPALGIPVEDLLQLSRGAREAEVPLHRFIESPPVGLELTSTAKQALGRLQADLVRLRPYAAGDVEALILKVAEESFLRAVFRSPGRPVAGAGGSPTTALGPAADPWVALGCLLRWARRFVQNEPDRNDLPTFLWYLDGIRKADVSESLPEEEENLPGDRISLMTVHQAKGLEFDQVLLIGLVQGQFPARSRPEPIPFPLDLMKERLPEGDYHLQEERRLCYVACTRARKGLFLLTQDRLRRRPSVFLQEMGGEGEGDPLRKRRGHPPSVPRVAGSVLPASSLVQEREMMRLAAEIRALSPSDEEGLGKRLQEIQQLAAALRGKDSSEASATVGSSQRVWPIGERFSFTQLETYRYCPLKYLYAYVYRLPKHSTPQMLFGVDLHECLEWFYQQLLQGKTPVLEELLDSFRRFHAPRRYGEPHEDEEYLRLGERILTAYYQKQEGHWALPLGVEKEFCLKLEEVSIKGVIDRIDPLPGGGVRIIDYKSGKPKEKANFEEQLQLWLYALAAREVLELDPLRVTFYYLRTNAELSFDRAPGLLEKAREQILSRARQIRTGEFSPTPSVTACGRCDYRNLCPSSAV